MVLPIADNENKLSNLQLEILKSLKYMATEEQLSDIRSLLRHYFANKSDTAIKRQKRKKDIQLLYMKAGCKAKMPQNKL